LNVKGVVGTVKVDGDEDEDPETVKVTGTLNGLLFTLDEAI
jgi:hypothetical protein